MEEGKLTDSFGRHVDFRNVILILTSNIGTGISSGVMIIMILPPSITVPSSRINPVTSNSISQR